MILTVYSVRMYGHRGVTTGTQESGARSYFFVLKLRGWRSNGELTVAQQTAGSKANRPGLRILLEVKVDVLGGYL